LLSIKIFALNRSKDREFLTKTMQDIVMLPIFIADKGCLKNIKGYGPMINNTAGHAVKMISLESAAAMIKSNDSIWVGTAFGISVPFLDQLADRQKELRNVTIVGESFLNCCKLLVDPLYRDTFHIVSLYEALPVNYLYNMKNNIDYVKRPPGPYVKTIYKKYHINVMAFEVCPPDGGNNCDLGFTGGAITRHFSKCGGIKIAIINAFQRAAAYDDGGSNSVSLSDFDYACSCRHPVPSQGPPCRNARGRPDCLF
jgi:hypothetical protein